LAEYADKHTRHIWKVTTLYVEIIEYQDLDFERKRNEEKVAEGNEG
jgi:hypothetical protein